MSKTITISKFYRGRADDRFSQEVGKFAHARHFDILTHKKKLQPVRGMSEHTSGTGITNLVVASDGLMYGAGDNNASPGNGKLWVMPGYGASDDFRACGTNQLGSGAVDGELLVDWADAGNVRRIHWACANLILCSNYDGGAGSATSDALTFTTIGQGYVHPKDKYLYFPYRTSSAGYIALLAPNATSFAGKNYTAFALPAAYRAYCLTGYGNFLAIPLTGVTATSLVDSNIVGLWDRDTTNTLFSETILWGQGVLKVLNNLNGVLIGVSEFGSSSLQAGTAQDYNAIQIKIFEGGAEPILVHEIKVQTLSGASGAPSVSINQRVNFIRNNRLYFSAVVNPNDGIQPSRIGMWSVGKNELGEWTCTLERVATNANTETSIIAAVMVGDYVEMVHTAAGTLTKSTNGNASSTTFGATSVYESLVNPEMPPDDRRKKKNLVGVSVNCEPLPTSGQLVLKYRVDSKGDDDDWVTVKTISTAGAMQGENTFTAAGETFTAGYNFEFRIESTGGAVPISFSYSYKDDTSSNL